MPVFKSYAIILLAILSVSLIAALILSRIFQRSISKPILRLAETAQLVSFGKDYCPGANHGDHDEVAVLVTAFNEMLAEIQKRGSGVAGEGATIQDFADSIPQLASMDYSSYCDDSSVVR